MNHNTKQNITTVGFKTLTDYSTIKIDINVRLTSVTAVEMASQKSLLIKYKEDCEGINKSSTRIDMPAAGRAHIRFKNHKNQMPVPYVIYADFESIIKPKSSKTGDKSEITTEHEACGFGYQVVRYDNVAYPSVIYRGEDAVDVFLQRLNQERHSINMKFKNPEPIIMTHQDEKDHQNATHCWICQEQIVGDANLDKVRDHCHFTGKYRGAAHKTCN